MVDNSSFDSLNERSQHLLKVLIEEYIEGGTPVASTALAKKSGLDLSSATIRNAMSNLEKKGFLSSPHTSAGRIPTSAGYRVFVDSLLRVQTLDEKTLKTMQGSFDVLKTPGDIIQSASSMLSGITQLAGLVTLPKRDSISFKHIEFVRLSDTQILVVLVLRDGEIQNRLLEVDRKYSSSELQEAANYLNETLEGRTLHEAKELLLEQMKSVHDDVNRMMQFAIHAADKTLNDIDDGGEEEFVVAGETNLIRYDDLSDLSKLRNLFQAFQEKSEMLTLLNTALGADGVQIYIGRESGYEVFDDCSLVTSTYRTEDDSVGVLGVIGPKRMSYEKVIPVVDITARLLSASFSSIKNKG